MTYNISSVVLNFIAIIISNKYLLWSIVGRALHSCANVLLLWLTCCCITNCVCYRLLVVTWSLFCDCWVVPCPLLCSWVFVSALHKTRLWCILCITDAQLDMILFIMQLMNSLYSQTLNTAQSIRFKKLNSITNCSFRYALSYLWNQLPLSFHQPHPAHSPVAKMADFSADMHVIERLW